LIAPSHANHSETIHGASRGATAETDRDPRLVEELVDALAVPRAGDLHVCRKNAGT